jgi:hypothetical protein
MVCPRLRELCETAWPAESEVLGESGVTKNSGRQNSSADPQREPPGD